MRHEKRSTKAGASTPATRRASSSARSRDRVAQRRPERQPRLHTPRGHGSPLHGHRSTKAGASTPATHDNLRLKVILEDIHRSTKAGASTPATHAARPPIAQRTQSAQRRPERQPRLHTSGSRIIDRPDQRSTKAGASTPATLLNSAKGQYRDKPSLVHGCGSLDNDAFASISRDFGRYPVRMVRIKQSRLP